MTTNKEYTIYFHGKMTVEAECEAEAGEKAYDELNVMDQTYEDGSFTFQITGCDEGECVECGGTGEVSTDEDDGEGHTMRGVGTAKCPCKISEPDEDSDSEV